MSEGSPGVPYLRQLKDCRLTTLEQAETLRILYAIPAAKAFCQQLAEKLADLVSPAWVAESGLAEIFAVLDALHAYGRPAAKGNIIAAVAKRLISSETGVGGPYANHDGTTGLKANAYIANCMAWLVAPLPRIEAFLSGEVVALRYNFQDIAVLARSYPQLARTALRQWQSLSGQTAGADFRLLAYYVAQQANAPAGPPLRAREGQNIPSRDPFQLALALFASGKRSALVVEAPPDNRLMEVIRTARATYMALPDPLRRQSLVMLEHLLQIDAAHEITLLPHFFADAYKGPTADVSPSLLSQLGSANIHTWLAYTIYDDFLDDEGQPPLLPVANVALRAAAETYRRVLPGHGDFQRYAAAAFIAVDAANSWELQHWRYAVSSRHMAIRTIPDFGSRQLLADRALLHILGPVAVLAASGKTAKDAVWPQTIGALRHYLIARQLTDDLHDWAKDLRAGHISYVVAEILRGLSASKGVYLFEQLLPAAQERFWQQELTSLCGTIVIHTQQAKQNLQPYMRESSTPFLSFISQLEDSMQTALAQQAQSQTFFHTFRNHPARYWRPANDTVQ